MIMRSETALLFTMIAATAFIGGTLSFRTIASNLKRISHLNMSSTASSTKQIIRILCYGDSLTAGTSPPMDQLFPYARYLERELNNMYSDGTSVAVRWRGLPGWTASTMMEYLDDASFGLRSAVNGIHNPSLSLVIILAGTNDIGIITSSMSGEVVDVAKAIHPILGLHKACLEYQNDDIERSAELKTLVVGIPGSAWQESNQYAKKLCADMNDSLKKFASTLDYRGKVSFVDFPFGYERGDSKWCFDGLHLSPEGYEVLGIELAKRVRHILDDS